MKATLTFSLGKEMVHYQVEVLEPLSGALFERLTPTNALAAQKQLDDAKNLGRPAVLGLNVLQRTVSA